MTPTEVTAIAEERLRADGCDVDRLRFSHAVFLPSWNAAGYGNRETWLVYFKAVEPSEVGIADYDWATVTVDAMTRKSHRV